MICIEDFGILGLPLSVSEAKHLIAASVTAQAPFGMGERTVVDRTVRDTWEVDGSKVSILLSVRSEALIEMMRLGSDTILQPRLEFLDRSGGRTPHLRELGSECCFNLAEGGLV